MSLKAKEAGTNSHGHTTSQFSRTRPHTLWLGPSPPHILFSKNTWLPGERYCHLPHFPSLKEALVDWGGGWSSLGWIICSKSPSFTDRDRKGNQLTLRAPFTIWGSLHRDRGWWSKEFLEKWIFWKNTNWQLVLHLETGRKHANALPWLMKQKMQKYNKLIFWRFPGPGQFLSG